MEAYSKFNVTETEESPNKLEGMGKKCSLFVGHNAKHERRQNMKKKHPVLKIFATVNS